MTGDRQVSVMWSDAELDAALAALRADVTVDSAATSAARTRLLTAAADATAASDDDVPLTVAAVAAKRRPAVSQWRRPGRALLAAAAAVAVLVSAGLLAPTLWTSHNRPVVSADAARILDQAAAAIGAVDPPVAAGQFRYVETNAWWSVSARYDLYLVENRISVWVPADPTDPTAEWMLDRAPTGNITWISGDREAFDAAGGPDVNGYPTMRVSAVCGDFYSPVPSCDRAGSWQEPTAAFLAALPRDPQQLLDRLRADAPDNGTGDAGLLVYAADALRSGLVPADLRSALYRALSELPGLEITTRPQISMAGSAPLSESTMVTYAETSSLTRPPGWVARPAGGTGAHAGSLRSQPGTAAGVSTRSFTRHHRPTAIVAVRGCNVTRVHNYATLSPVCVTLRR